MKKQVLGAAGILAAGLIAGSAFSITAGANAADTTPTPTASSSTSTPSTAPSFGAGNDKDIFSATPIRDDEKAVTADELAKLTAAAQAKVPGATIIRIETDGDGAAFEAHMNKADGSAITVKFDSSYNVTGTEDGFGPGPKGGHGPHGDGDHDGQGGDNDGDGPAFQVPSTGSTSGTQNG